MNWSMRSVGVGLVFFLGLGVAGVQAQQPVAAEPQAPSGTVQSPREVVPPLPVPRLVKFAGTLKDELGKPRTGVVGVTFAVYKEQEGGAALWLETQNVELDEQGHYTVLLGSSRSEGLPLELFTAGEPRWLGVQANLPKETEQPRVLLVSVPYALKASDADTLGGKPASVYLTTEQAGGVGTTGKTSGGAGLVSSAVSGTGSANVVPKWLDNAGTLGNSQITDDGTNVNMPGNVGALAYKFTGNASTPTDATATILNQANVGPVFSGLSFKVRTGAPVPADALSIDTSQNASITGNASALAYKFTGNAAVPTDATATIFNQAGVGPTFSGLSFSVRTGVTPANALTVDQNHNLRLTNGGALVFPDGSVMSSAATGIGGGTITAVTAGTGLIGGGTSGNATLGIANGGVTNTLLGANSVTNANIGDASLNPAKITGIAATLGSNSFMGSQTIAGTGDFVASVVNGAALTGYNPLTTGAVSPRGVYGQADSSAGVGVHGFSNSGLGVLGVSGSGTAGTFNSGVGKILSGQSNGTEVFSVDGGGTVHANAYQDLAGNPISGNVTQILYSGITTATSTFTPTLLLTPGTFSKASAATAITATWVSDVSGGTGDGSNFCQFELRIDNTVPTGTTAGSGGAVTYAQYQAVTLIGRWTGLAAGSHAVSIWLRGSGVSCRDNYGNFQRQVYIAEF